MTIRMDRTFRFNNNNNNKKKTEEIPFKGTDNYTLDTVEFKSLFQSNRYKLPYLFD